MQKLLLAVDKLSTVIGQAFSWLIVVLTLLITWEVFSRYALDNPHPWAFDVMSMLYGSVFMMAGAYTLSKNGHVRGDVLYGFFPPRLQAGLDLAIFNSAKVIPVARIPEAPLLFPEEMLTDYPRKLFISDIIREKYFGILLAELPHAIAVFIEAIEESEAGWNITGELLVNKASQKGIVLGRNGGLLKKVQKEAAAELSAIYEKPVRLRLHVRVSPNWAANGSELDRLGYRL